MQAGLGTLVNGLYSINQRIYNHQKIQLVLFISTFTNIISSILLFVLLNTIYFYQGRRKFFIERLSGKSFIAIHKKYLISIGIIYVVLSGVILFLNANINLLVTLILSSIVSLLIFMVQLYKERKANILYLKGE